MIIIIDSVQHCIISTDDVMEKMQSSIKWSLQSQPLKWKCHFDEILIPEVTISGWNDNFQCIQWLQFHQNEEISDNFIKMKTFQCHWETNQGTTKWYAYFMGYNTAMSLVQTHWRYHSLVPNHQYNHNNIQQIHVHISWHVLDLLTQQESSKASTKGVYYSLLFMVY